MLHKTWHSLAFLVAVCNQLRLMSGHEFIMIYGTYPEAYVT